MIFLVLGWRQDELLLLAGRRGEPGGVVQSEAHDPADDGNDGWGQLGLDEGITMRHEIRAILVVEICTAYVCYETNGLVNWVAYASSPDRCHLSAIGHGGYGAPAAPDWESNQLSPTARAPCEPATSRRHPGPQYAGHRHVGTPGQPPCTGCKDPHPDCSRSGPAPSPWIPAGLPCCPPELA